VLKVLLHIITNPVHTLVSSDCVSISSRSSLTRSLQVSLVQTTMLITHNDNNDTRLMAFTPRQPG